MKKIKNYIMGIPFGFISLALGVMALGTGWTQYTENSKHLPGQLFTFSAPWVIYITMAVTCFFTLLMIIKIIFNFQWFCEDLIKNKIASAHFAVFPLVIINIGGFILGFQTKNNNIFTHTGGIYIFGIIVWYIGLIMATAFFLYWSVLEARDFKWKNVDAVWYVPPAGLAAACVDSKLLGSNYDTFVKVWWYIIFAILMVFLICIWYRYLFIKGHDSELGSIGVLSSINSFMLLTYSGAFAGQFQFGTVFFLGATSMTVTIIIYITMLKTYRKKFYIGLTSYSFPLTASAVARMIFGNYMLEITGNIGIYNFFLVWGMVELIISTINIFYLIGGTGYIVTKNWIILSQQNKQSKINSNKKNILN